MAPKSARIPTVKCHPGFFVAILFYTVLDLSLPMLPGAFVFDAGDSVDSVQVTRGRGTSDVSVLPARLNNPCAVTSAPDDVRGKVSATGCQAPWRRPRVVSSLPRAALDSPASSEDSH